MWPVALHWLYFYLLIQLESHNYRKKSDWKVIGGYQVQPPQSTRPTLKLDQAQDHEVWKPPVMEVPQPVWAPIPVLSCCCGRAFVLCGQLPGRPLQLLSLALSWNAWEESDSCLLHSPFSSGKLVRFPLSLLFSRLDKPVSLADHFSVKEDVQHILP